MNRFLIEVVQHTIVMVIASATVTRSARPDNFDRTPSDKHQQPGKLARNLSQRNSLR
ncbi:MAG: hypothetical protein H6951_20515 [Zoogloeaceae bacterium]|nr:hypothetical protein [Zoogloeaceae bacterium]